MSDVRRESGGEISPDTEYTAGPDQPEEYGGGAALEYMAEVGLTTAVAAIAMAIAGRSMCTRSTLSRLMSARMPLENLVLESDGQYGANRNTNKKKIIREQTWQRNGPLPIVSI